MRFARCSSPLVSALLVLAMARHASGQTGPQDHWTPELSRSWSVAALGIAAAKGRVFVSVDHTIRVYTPEGVLTNTFGGTASATPGKFNAPRGMVAEGDLLFVADRGNNRIQVINATNGVAVAYWGSSGSGPGQFSLNGLMDVAVDSNHVYTVETGNCRIQKFTRTGTFVKTWGQQGSTPERFYYPISIAADRRWIYVAERGFDMNHIFNRIQVFDKDGTFVRLWEPTVGTTTLAEPQSIRSDGSRVYVGFYNNHCPQCNYWAGFQIYDTEGNKLVAKEYGWPYSGNADYDVCNVTGIAIASPYLYLADAARSRVLPMSRYFRTLGALPPRAIPVTEVLSSAQRPSDAVLDIDYVVHDSDSAAVTVRAAAFVVDTGSYLDLDHIIPMRSFVDGTSSNTGPGIAVGDVRRLSWDMETDGAQAKLGAYGDVRVSILCKDERDLLDLHFLTIPAMGSQPEFLISRAPVEQQDLLPLWFWLLAAGDTNIVLNMNQVIGRSPPHAGQVLAEGTNTTASGRTFLFSLLGVRQASSVELTTAREATTPGTVTMWDPVREPPTAGYKVNEFNLVTYPTNGWWVVPLDP